MKTKRLPKKLHEKARFEDEVIAAIRKTDIEERQMIAAEFENGARSYWPKVAARGIDPLALLVASLVDAESPLVMRGERITHGSLLDCAKWVVNYRPEFFQPVDNFVKTGDNSHKTVDNVVENPVDKIASYPQFGAKKPKIASNLNSYPQPVDNY